MNERERSKRIGRLFVFEGPDGAGKTTLSKAFAELLLADKIQCDHLAFPGCEERTLGRHVYELHHGNHVEKVGPITPTSLQLLHIAAHIDALSTRIIPALNAGRTVVLDRFWWSTWVYGMLTGVDQHSLCMMIDLERIHWGAIVPQAVFLLHRNVGTNMTPGQTNSLLIEEYLKLANREALKYPVIHVSNNADIEEVLRSIRLIN